MDFYDESKRNINRDYTCIIIDEADSTDLDNLGSTLVLLFFSFLWLFKCFISFYL